MFAEQCAEVADDAGPVLVVQQQQNSLGRDFDREAEEADDARIVRRTEKGAARGNNFRFASEQLHVQPLVEGHGFVRAFLLDVQTLRHGGGADVDVVHVLRCPGREIAAQNRACDGINVRKFLRFAAKSDVDAVHERRRELAQEPPELLTEHEVGLDLLVRFRVEEREVHGVADFAGEQVSGDDLGNFDAAFFLRLLGARAEVRRENDVGQFAERMIRRERFDDEHVERRTADAAGLQRGDEVVFLHDFTAGAIHEAHAGLHFCEGFGVEHVAGFLGDGHVNGDEIRLLVNPVGIARGLEAKLLGPRVGEKRIVGQHAHSERERAFADLGADAARAENAERFAANFGALKKFAVPFAGGHRGVGGGDFAGQRAEHEEGQLGGGEGVAAGRVHHDDPALRGRLDIDVVHAHAGAADDFELTRGLEHLLGDLGFRAHHDGIDLGDDGQQVGLGEAFFQHGDLKFRALPEQFNAAGRDGIADQYLHKKIRGAH